MYAGYGILNAGLVSSCWRDMMTLSGVLCVVHTAINVHNYSTVQQYCIVYSTVHTVLVYSTVHTVLVYSTVHTVLYSIQYCTYSTVHTVLYIHSIQ